MKCLNKTATATLVKLVKGLKVGEERKFDNAPGTYLALHIIRRSEHVYTINHWIEVNGDSCYDPAMDFFVVDKGHPSFNFVTPISITQTVGVQLPERRAMKLNEKGEVTSYYPRELAEQVSFANMWLKNIKYQQKLK